MSARVTVSQTTSTTAPPAAPSSSGRLFIIGRAASGPAEPTSVRGVAEFADVFGARIGANPDLADTLNDAFRFGLAEAVVLRALGPAAASATVVLGGTLTVTAAGAGAYANGWTAAYDSSTKTLTVVAGSTTETYTGTDLATLLSAASASSTVTVTGSALPSSTVAATALAGGDDDFDGVDYADLLELFPADLGPGAVAVAGVLADTVGADLLAHAASNNRLALLTTDAASVSEAVTDADTIGATAGSSEAVLLWPDLIIGGQTRKPLGFVAGVRATAIGNGSVGQSPIARRYGVTGVTPAVITTDAQFTELDEGRVSAIRLVGGRAQIDTWKRLANPAGDSAGSLAGAEKADLLHDIAANLNAVGENYIGRLVNGPQALVAYAGDLGGVLQGYASQGLLYPGADDPGFAVDTATVNSPASLAAGDLNASVGVRLSPTAAFVFITVTATDAAGTI